MPFFKKQAIGLDISDRTIEVVLLKNYSSGPKIETKGRIEIEEGIVKNGRIINEEKLIKLVKKALEKARLNKISEPEIIFGLPENLVFFHIFKLPKNIKNKYEIQEKIDEEVSKNIPLEKNDCQRDYRIIDSNQGKLVILVAALKEVLSEWKSFFKKCGLKVKIFDIETLAVFRGLYKNSPKDPICLVDIGDSSTSISIFNKKGLFYSYSFQTAGALFTKKISEELNISYKEAEKLKIENGLIKQNKKVLNILKEELYLIINEINISLTFYEGKHKEKINEIIFVGGSSKMKGFIDFFKKYIKKPLSIGYPRLSKDKSSFDYLGAIGLALKSIEKQWQEKDPCFKVYDIQEIKKIAPLKEKPKIEKTNLETEEDEKYVKNKELNEKLNNLFKSQTKIKHQFILLIIIIALGIIAVSLAFWYRNIDREKRSEKISAKYSIYSQVQILDLQVPVAVNEKEYTEDRVSGRIIENTIVDNQSYEDALALSAELANMSLKNDELLTMKPINQINSDSLIFPLKIAWIAFNKNEAENLFIKEIQRINDKNISYILNSINFKDVEPTDNPNIYLLNGEAKIFADNIIE